MYFLAAPLLTNPPVFIESGPSSPPLEVVSAASNTGHTYVVSEFDGLVQNFSVRSLSSSFHTYEAKAVNSSTRNFLVLPLSTTNFP